MAIAIVDKKGKVELPKEYLARKGIKPGYIVRIIEQPNGQLVQKIGKDAMALAGSLSNNGIHLSLEDINRIT